MEIEVRITLYVNTKDILLSDAIREIAAVRDVAGYEVIDTVIETDLGPEDKAYDYADYAYDRKMDK